ncbi:4Fe-4S ferredoxin [Methanocaldococcus villosus KIN24-T80]|uniref:4Fe-4S ferredoxin n=1 Tax=Methanocaldococcus villosus KIN24-T80 TaxID=1069083 RepID=N6VXG4_9EURY|nr:4Fe-4S binding protein [Methanocaldococcus villosus]ENN95822.1 4Fe-4S ferredoxin [Methanocaldococcus villosus KIN24-T80]
MSFLGYIYEIKENIKDLLFAKSKKSYYIPPKRYRKIPPSVVYPEKCISCSACKESCPAFAIEMKYNNEHKKELPLIDEGSCIACANCVEVCPTGVLEIDKHRVETEDEPYIKPKYNYLLIDEEICVKCGNCKKVCPVEAIYKKEKKYYINIQNCISCKRCLDACPVNAIVILDEKTFKEKNRIFFDLKIKKEMNKLKYEEKIEKTPHIVNSLCILCRNCKEICFGEIDLEKKVVIKCVKCGYCLEVCPTSAIRVYKERIAKNKDSCYIINEDQCIGCRICYKVCEVNAIKISKETKLPYILPEKCVACGLCARECPVNAIKEVKKDMAMKEVEKRIIEDKIIEKIENELYNYMEEYSKILQEVEITAKKSLENEVKKRIKNEIKRIKDLKRGYNGDG